MTKDDVLGTILCLLILAGASSSEAQMLHWTMPTTDVEDNYISPEVMYANLYWGYDNSEWFLSGPMPESPVSLEGIPAGCYHLRLTAVRTDTEPDMESAPSSSIRYCTGEVPPDTPTGVGVE